MSNDDKSIEPTRTCVEQFWGETLEFVNEAFVPNSVEECGYRVVVYFYHNIEKGVDLEIVRYAC